jgi:hypothetical protein
MATKLYGSKEITTDGLIYGLNPPVEAFFVTIRALGAEKTLPRGTVLALSATDKKMVVLGNGDAKANCILCDDTVVGTEDVKAMAYRQGHFAVEKLTVADDYTLTAEDKETLRGLGILLSNAVEV